MKKLFTIALALVIVTGIAKCGSGVTSSDPEEANNGNNIASPEFGNAAIESKKTSQEPETTSNKIDKIESALTLENNESLERLLTNDDGNYRLFAKQYDGETVYFEGFAEGNTDFFG